jgi:prepilin-type N-terminal cleavage/methylation domain-containing protein
MSSTTCSSKQSGFSMIELLVSLGVMLIVTASVMSLLKDSFHLSLTTYEMTDAQESLRTAQEYINRDLITAGDGMRGLNNTCVSTLFVTNYLTMNPGSNPCGVGLVNLPLIHSDNDVPLGTVVLGFSTAATVRSTPAKTDRIVILQIDPSFTPIPVAANAITGNGLSIKVSAGDFGRVGAGEIYFISSSVGSTFGTITGKTVGNTTLSFAAGDTYFLNQPTASGPINLVSGGGTQAASIMRMRIITYFVTNTGLLVRRVFGVPGGIGFSDSVIAEYVRSLQFRYILGQDADGLLPQPVAQLSNSDQQSAVREVEVSVTTETPHAMANGTPPSISMTTTTSVRNLQFLEALQP